MGGFFETDKMKRHVASCSVCQAAHAGANIRYMECCDEYSEMFNNVIDYESGDGPFEDRPDALMCVECDGPVEPGRVCEKCGACGCLLDEDGSTIVACPLHPEGGAANERRELSEAEQILKKAQAMPVVHNPTDEELENL